MTTADATGTPPATPPSADAPRAGRPRGWISARVRILLWLLVVMAVALTAVATTTRSILLREVDQRVTRLLAQEAGEFANLVERGLDPETGRPFTSADRLLRVFLERQYSDPDEELLGVVDGNVIRQSRDIPSALPLHKDKKSLRRITSDSASAGVLHRARGELRWAKVVIEPGGDTSPHGTFVVAFHADREQQSAEDVFHILLAISGVALLMTVCIGWAVAGRILAPVRLVRSTAAQLTEQDLTRRIPVNGKDDIAALAETFNAMLDRLERAFAGQRQFVDDAGHELRTPITIVRGHLEVMGTATETAAEREETIRLVTDELDRMSRIVEDLLLLAKSERPDFVSPEPVELAELTADVFVKARTLGDRDWQLAGVAEGTVLLDPQRITQAMVQLAQNAVQHTSRGATLRIGSRRPVDADGAPGAVGTGSTGGAGEGTGNGSGAAGTVELYVVDHGPGIGTDDAHLIFERFRRGATRRGAREHGSGGHGETPPGGGAGLGLSIVKAIAEGHPGGRVEVRRTDGGGATFVLVVQAGEPEDRTSTRGAK